MFTRNGKNSQRSVRKYFCTRSIFLCVLFIVCTCYIIAYIRKSSGDDDTNLVNNSILWKKPVLCKNFTAATSLYNEVRILCLVLIKKDYKRYEHIESTWGKRCNSLVILERTKFRNFDENTDFAELKVEFDYVWPDVKTSLQYIYYNHLNEADWFLKTNDETYVIMENLRYYLYSYRSEEPLYFMYEPFEPEDRLSKESVYVLNKEGLENFIRLALKKDEKCQVQQFAYESTQMASCLDNAGVMAIDTRNAQGISAFLPHYLYTLDVIKNYKPNWRSIRRRFMEICCPEYPIFYQQLSSDEMRLLDFVIYRLQIYGTSLRLGNLRAELPIYSHAITNHSDESVNFKT